MKTDKRGKRNYKFLFPGTITALFILLSLGCSVDSEPVTIFENANIYTLEESAPKAEAMVISSDGKIAYIGDTPGTKRYRGKRSVVIDMNKKTILPGLIESHAHPGAVSVLNAGDMLYIPADMNMDQIISFLKDHLIQNPDKQHIIGLGYALLSLGLPEGMTPTAEDLDKISSKIPILLYDESMHSSWANSKALENAGIDENSPDPIPGTSYYVRYPETNIPTGYMYEITGHIVANAMPFNILDIICYQLEDILDHYSELGVTAIYDAGNFYSTEYDAIARIEREGKLNQYYQKSYPADLSLTPAENVVKLKRLDQNYTRGNLYVNVYKIYEDGTIEVESAALIDPYTSSGIIAEPFMNEEQNYDHISAALTAGYPVHCHAIGDKAQKYALDAFLKTRDINPHITRTIAHNQVFEPEGLEKYRIMKDIIFCQSTPSWTTSYATEETLKRIGIERFNRQYLWGLLLEEGVPVTFGSDYPANLYEDINPFRQMYYAVMRKLEPENYFPPVEAGVTVEQAVRAYTIDGARQMGISDITGSLKEGKYADFIVIDRDIMRIDPWQIKYTTVEHTYFRGKIIK